MSEEPPDAAVAEAQPAELAAGADAYDETDEAVLDLVAAEMAAPDADNADHAVASKPAHVTEPPLIEPFLVASEPEPAAMAEAWPRPSSSLAPVPSEKPSLGATIIATGILPRPKPPASDPLAPIRRMSQAEKIAFFS